MKIVGLELGERSYPILIQNNLLTKITIHLKGHAPTEQAVIISDQSVSQLYGETVSSALKNAGIQTDLFIVPDGEDSKSWKTMGNLLTRCIQTGLKRDGLIIALGGGVIGDLAGFVAATYLRGVNFVQVPTSLLAQVDSSVGGKVGINHPMGKNLIGNFYQPKLVLIDPMTLTTLDKREMWAGMGEVVKYGLIWDEAFFKQVEDSLHTLIHLKDMEAVADMLAFCCRAKADVVEKDEKEGGLRRILNFGHTVGHALEAATDYHYFKHGEAVVHGMHWAAWVSRQEQFISESEFNQIESLLKQFAIPVLPDNLVAENLISRIKIDKKQTGKGLHVVLLEAIGKTKILKVEDMTPWVKAWLIYMQKK
ncbi:3-dehydroquinate synthase [bacterium]|nr:3-dehydroquinate synthase [bacterium]